MTEQHDFDPTMIGERLYLTRPPKFMQQHPYDEVYNNYIYEIIKFSERTRNSNTYLKFNPFIFGPRLFQNQRPVPINVLSMECRCRLAIDESIEKFERAGIDIRCFELPPR